MLNKEDHYAYPAVPHLEAVMRLASVKRWHMIDTTRTQNLAEHSANVAALAFVIARTCPLMNYGPADTVLATALFHDMDEVFIGDIPTHSKQWINAEDLRRAEESVTPDIFRSTNVPTHVRDMIKVCDLADGIRFIRLHGVDMTAPHAQAGLEKQYWTKLTLMRGSVTDLSLYHTICMTYFYAYEAGSHSTPIAFPTDAWEMVTNLARGQGNIAGSSRREFRDAFPWTRDRMAGTEGGGVQTG